MWVLLPVKRFAVAKSRLAPLLSHRQRAELALCMLEDVLDALRCARSVEGVLVLSNEPGIDAVLGAAGAERVPETREGNLNWSLMTTAAALTSSVDRMLILPSDVPAVSPDDIDDLSEAHTGGVTLCPAEVDGGTNALLSSLPLGISLQFGPRSLVRHLENARLCGVAARIVSCRGLARDLDRGADLDWFADSAYSGRTHSYLQRQLNGLEV